MRGRETVGGKREGGRFSSQGARRTTEIPQGRGEREPASGRGRPCMARPSWPPSRRHRPRPRTDEVTSDFYYVEEEEAPEQLVGCCNYIPGGRQGGREAGPGAYGSLRYRAESFLLLRANRLRPFWRRKGRREEGRKEEEREGKAVKESGQSEGQREQRPRREGGGRVSAAPQLHSPTERATAATVRRRTEARTLQRTEREVHERTDERTDGRTGATAPDRSLGFCTFGAVDSYF